MKATEIIIERINSLSVCGIKPESLPISKEEFVLLRDELLKMFTFTTPDSLPEDDPKDIKFGSVKLVIVND